MTRTLILTRHAKSSWGTPGQQDHDRPLNKRGRQSAEVLGGWFREQGLQPDQVLSSSSKRTRETYDGLRLKAEADFTDHLYHASADQMLRVLSRASGEVVLMLGHNPGIGAFAVELAVAPSSHPRFYDYPTGATTVLQFGIDDWQQLAWANGKVVDFVIPRELLE